MIPSDDGAVLVLTTTADEESARALSRTLVLERLAACVTRSGVRSVYRWEKAGEGHVAADAAVCEEDEVLLVIKTSRSRVGELESRLLQLHPYACPEVVRVSPEQVDARYLAWLLGATTVLD